MSTKTDIHTIDFMAKLYTDQKVCTTQKKTNMQFFLIKIENIVALKILNDTIYK